MVARRPKQYLRGSRFVDVGLLQSNNSKSAIKNRYVPRPDQGSAFLGILGTLNHPTKNGNNSNSAAAESRCSPIRLECIPPPHLATTTTTNRIKRDHGTNDEKVEEDGRVDQFAFGTCHEKRERLVTSSSPELSSLYLPNQKAQ